MAKSFERNLEEKIYKRRRKNKAYASPTYIKVQQFQWLKEVEIQNAIRNEITNRLKDRGFDNFDYQLNKVEIPKKFNLIENYLITFNIIEDFVGSILSNLGGEIEINFGNCTFCDTSALFLLQVLRFEIEAIYKSRSKNFQIIQNHTEFKVSASKNKHVNRMLLLSGLISKETYDECLVKTNEDNSDLMEPLYRTGYYKGSQSQKHYLENKKGDVTTEIVNYINKCLAVHDSSLRALKQSNLEGVLTEILNNAEDHGVFTYWYVTANFSIESANESTDDHLVGQLNLSILNFGKSISQGLIDTKTENEKYFSELLKAKNNLENAFPGHDFSDENLFTLYALQEGTSRLKYLDESRGTGTIKFLNSFAFLGDYVDLQKKYIPHLSIVSGRTIVICDNDHKPFDNNGVFILTLNREKSLRHPPNKKNLINLGKNFPGTLLNVCVYLTKKHLKSKE